MNYRIEHDSMGEVRVPADKCWGAQTQRSVENFPIGVGLETMPREIIRAFGLLKKAAAMANARLKPEKMTPRKLEAISAACDQIIAGERYDQFPLVVWQTGYYQRQAAGRAGELAQLICLCRADDVGGGAKGNALRNLVGDAE